MEGASNGSVPQTRVRTRLRPPQVPGPQATQEQVTPSTEGRVSPKHAKFRELGVKRVERALGAIKVIGNLASRNYEYSEADAAKIVKRLRAAVDELEDRFKPSKGQGRDRFEF